jgi:hypothetical protein
MCSYNQLAGQYACANPFLLKETFHGLFGSDGFSVSDAVACHEPANDLNAGLNFDIVGSCYAPPLVETALASGLVSQATFEQRVRSPASGSSSGSAGASRLARPPDQWQSQVPLSPKARDTESRSSRGR